MADIVSKQVRSRMMSGIGGKDTKPEIALRKALFAKGLRYRLHAKHLPGRPDIVLPKWNAVVFVHGCFWHRHPSCKFTTTPSTRPEFWREKFEGNVSRDARNTGLLVDLGWRVAVVWECGIRKDIETVAESLVPWIINRHTAKIEIAIDTEA
ncbi:UNVERIFIED_CONTAM: hypothetical protein GTU68_058564 [Idotea baltica]|nr:hypothetical protein [Idotea baltica]